MIPDPRLSAFFSDGLLADLAEDRGPQRRPVGAHRRRRLHQRRRVFYQGAALIVGVSLLILGVAGVWSALAG